MHVLGYKKKETADNESLEQYVIIIKVSINLKKKKKLRDCRKTPVQGDSQISFTPSIHVCNSMIFILLLVKLLQH